MIHAFDYETAERSMLIERCRAFETLHSAEHALCMSAFKERDTYRDLCLELLDDLKSQVAAFAYAMGKKSLADSDELITKAESILGEKNGTAN